MSPDQLFSIVNAIAAIGWILLMLWPRKHWTIAVTGSAIPILMATIYVAIVATVWAGSSGSFSSLAGVSLLFSNPWLLLAGWVHYLAFDLLIGVWEVHDAHEHGIHRLLIVPCLLLTFLFGPAGWLLYLTIRRTHRSFREATPVRQPA
jgi:hypothetical protein